MAILDQSIGRLLTHLERVYQKLRVESRVAAAALAWEALHTSLDSRHARVQREN
jgi:DNA-binding CsgD family transcriptional regulator